MNRRLLKKQNKTKHREKRIKQIQVKSASKGSFTLLDLLVQHSTNESTKTKHFYLKKTQQTTTNKQTNKKQNIKRQHLMNSMARGEHGVQ